MDRFVLIDGNAIVHRAFHALPPLTGPDGAMANAVYGFFSMFLKILSDVKPSYVAVCFDRPKPTFRQLLYVGYQAQRPSMSDDLKPQIGKLHEMLKNIGVSIFEIDGYEADDLIGTISKQAVEGKLNGGVDVIIVSGDRDLLQLVNGHVKMIAPITGITNMIIYDAHAVEQKFGIKPAQIVDYKALVGDASDNYPGISGIGPKTASDLLRQYDTFEDLYKNLDKLPPKIVEKLSADAEQGALAKKLATIVTDAPLTFRLSECSISNMDMEAAKKEFEMIGFKSLVKRVSDNGNEEIVKKRENKQLGLL